MRYLPWFFKGPHTRPLRVAPTRGRRFYATILRQYIHARYPRTFEKPKQAALNNPLPIPFAVVFVFTLPLLWSPAASADRVSFFQSLDCGVLEAIGGITA